MATNQRQLQAQLNKLPQGLIKLLEQAETMANKLLKTQSRLMNEVEQEETKGAAQAMQVDELPRGSKRKANKDF